MSILSVLQVGRALRDTLHELHILSLHTWKVAKTTRESDIEIVFRVHLYSVFFFPRDTCRANFQNDQTESFTTETNIGEEEELTNLHYYYMYNLS